MEKSNTILDLIEVVEVGLTKLPDYSQNKDLSNKLIIKQCKLGWDAILFRVFYKQ